MLHKSLNAMEAVKNVFSIKDLEDLSGIKSHTIRIWEKRYSILEPDRSDSNIRSYNENELRKILNIAYLNRKGHKISKIAQLSDDELSEQVITLNGMEDADNDFRPGKILMSALRFSDELFRKSLIPYIETSGLENAYIKYFNSLLEKAGILWQTGSLSRAQEQFIRHTVGSLIIAEDSRLSPPADRKRPTVAMINTTDSRNDVNFLFYKYILRKRNFDVIFPGGVLPAGEAEEIFKIKPYDFLVVNANTFDFTAKMSGYFLTVGKSLMIRKIIFADSQESGAEREKKIIMTADPHGFVMAVDNLL